MGICLYIIVPNFITPIYIPDTITPLHKIYISWSPCNTKYIYRGVHAIQYMVGHVCQIKSWTRKVNRGRDIHYICISWSPPSPCYIPDGSIRE